MARYKAFQYIEGETEWQDEAACEGASSDDFYNSANLGKQGADLEKHLPGRYKYCLPSADNNDTECPVRRQCLEYAIRHHEDNGIWGGLTTAERKRYVKTLELQSA